MKVVLNVPHTDADDPRLAAAAPGARFVRPADDAALLAEIGDAEVLFGGHRLGELLAHAPALRWVHSASAGMEGYLAAARRRPELILTSSAGAYDTPIAEHSLAMLLALRRQLHVAVRQHVEGRWQRLPEPLELAGSTLGIVGLGSIGRATARIAGAGFGMRVLGHKLRPCDPPPHVAELFYGRDGLRAMLAECDAVLIAAALTEATRGLVDAAALDGLPAHAVLLNIARGAIVDEAALIEQLTDGRLAGAGLDVFTTEPLPAESPLWKLPNVIVTPHNAGWSSRVPEHRLELFREQLRRYVAGEPLRNVVDRAAGY